MFLRTEKIPVKRKQLTGQTGHVIGTGRKFPSYVVVEHTALGGLMDMRLLQVHAVALDCAGDAADEDHGAIRFQPLDDAHMGQGIVHLAVSVEIPRVIEKYEITGTDVRLSMKDAMLTHMVVDKSDTIPFWITESSIIQIDTMFQEDGPGNPGTVIGDTFTLACNSPRADQFSRRFDDSQPSWERRQESSRVMPCGRRGRRSR